MIRANQLLFACRMLRKNPGTSVLAVVALALGIGLTASMFSVVHGILMSRVPFADPDRLTDLVSFSSETGPLGLRSPQVPVHDFADWREQQTTFSGLAAYRTGSVNLNDEAGYPERYGAGLVAWNTFGVLGVDPVLGRGFDAGDDVPGAARVASTCRSSGAWPSSPAWCPPGGRRGSIRSWHCAPSSRGAD